MKAGVDSPTCRTKVVRTTSSHLDRQWIVPLEECKTRIKHGDERYQRRSSSVEEVESSYRARPTALDFVKASSVRSLGCLPYAPLTVDEVENIGILLFSIVAQVTCSLRTMRAKRYHEYL